MTPKQLKDLNDTITINIKDLQEVQTALALISICGAMRESVRSNGLFRLTENLRHYTLVITPKEADEVLDLLENKYRNKLEKLGVDTARLAGPLVDRPPVP